MGRGDEEVMMMNMEMKPAWLQGLMGETFFGGCGVHENCRKNEKNIFCLLCCLSICPHCLPSHRSHPLLQVLVLFLQFGSQFFDTIIINEVIFFFLTFFLSLFLPVMLNFFVGREWILWINSWALLNFPSCCSFPKFRFGLSHLSLLMFLDNTFFFFPCEFDQFMECYIFVQFYLFCFDLIQVYFHIVCLFLF